MKISELLFEATPHPDWREARKITYEEVAQFVLKLALKAIKGQTPEVTSEIKQHFKNDRFWSEQIHDIIPEIERWMAGDSDLDDSSPSHPAEVVSDAVNDVAEKIIEFYDDHWNHPPGAKLPTLTYNESGFSFSDIEKLMHSTWPFTKNGTARDKIDRDEKATAHQKLVAVQKRDARKPESVSDIAKKIDANWSKIFNDKMYKRLAKKPGDYDFDTGFAPHSAKEIGEASKRLHDPRGKYTLAYHVLEFFSRFDDETDMSYEDRTALYHIMKSPKTFQQLVSQSNQLKKFE